MVRRVKGLFGRALCLLILSVCLTEWVQGGFLPAPSSDFQLISFFASPASIAINYRSRTLYVSDHLANRIFRFDGLDSLAAASAPSVIFGQLDTSGVSPNQGLPAPTASTLNGPKGIWIDDAGTLWAADYKNHRVLWWRNADSKPTNSPADGVVGQSSFTAASPQAGQGGLNKPSAVTVQGSTLWIADEVNNRVLRFDGATIAGFPAVGALAAGVLGQPDFVGTGSGASSSQFFKPTYILPHSSGLYVVDSNNHRVMYFPSDQLGRTSGGQALYVYGKSSFGDGSLYPPSESTFNLPIHAALGSDGTLFVADQNNNRVLQFPPVPPTQNGMGAVALFGQSNFTFTTPGPAADQLNSPFGISFDPSTNHLYIADYLNLRLQRYPSVLLLLQQPGAILPTSLSFVGKTPSLFFYPRSGSGSISPGQQEVYIEPSRVDEVGSTGSSVSVFSFPKSGYTTSYAIDSANTQRFAFSNSDPYPSTMGYSIYSQRVALQSAGVGFTEDVGYLKLDVLLQGWTFGSTSNRLLYRIRLVIKPAITNVTEIDTTGVKEFLLSSNDTMYTTLRLLKFGIVDNTTIVSVPVTLNYTLGMEDVDIVLDIPYFSKSFYYDPDFSVTVGGGGGGDGGDGGSTELLGLLALLIFLPCIILFVVFLIGFVIYLYIRKYKLLSTFHQQDTGAINFD